MNMQKQLVPFWGTLAICVKVSVFIHIGRLLSGSLLIKHVATKSNSPSLRGPSSFRHQMSLVVVSYCFPTNIQIPKDPASPKYITILPYTEHPNKRKSERPELKLFFNVMFSCCQALILPVDVQETLVGMCLGKTSCNKMEDLPSSHQKLTGCTEMIDISRIPVKKL